MSIGPPRNITYNRATGLLSWSAVAGADRYLVMEKSQLQSPRRQVASTAATSYSVGVVAESGVRAWVVIPIGDFAGIRGIPSRPVRVSGFRRKLVNQDPLPAGADVLFGDGTAAQFGDGTGAEFGD